MPKTADPNRRALCAAADGCNVSVDPWRSVGSGRVTPTRPSALLREPPTRTRPQPGLSDDCIACSRLCAPANVAHPSFISLSSGTAPSVSPAASWDARTQSTRQPRGSTAGTVPPGSPYNGRAVRRGRERTGAVRRGREGMAADGSRSICRTQRLEVCKLRLRIGRALSDHLRTTWHTARNIATRNNARGSHTWRTHAAYTWHASAARPRPPEHARTTERCSMPTDGIERLSLTRTYTHAYAQAHCATA